MCFPLKWTLAFNWEPKTKTLVFNSFTIIKFLEQNFCRPSNCFCRPCSLSEIRTKSSAHNKWATMVIVILLDINIVCK